VKYLKAYSANTRESVEIVKAIEQGSPVKVEGELRLTTAERKYYQVNIQPIYSNKQEVLGRVVSFSDISEHKNLSNQLSMKNSQITIMNQELLEMNQQLKQYAATAEELAITKERNRIARDAHDTIGHTMAKVITLMEVSSILIQQEPQAAVTKLDEAIEIAREGLEEIKRSIAGLRLENLELNNLKRALQNLFTDFLSAGIKIDFSIDGPYVGRPAHSEVIYRVCQEALTNAHRHGKARLVTIILKFLPKQIKLYIFDDGLGCRDLKKGSGLAGMEQRVQEVGGPSNTAPAMKRGLIYTWKSRRGKSDFQTQCGPGGGAKSGGVGRPGRTRDQFRTFNRE
jgi:signal transduction histidine kinase